MKSGKTVLFVSHNTSTIMQVCTRCILLENGRLIEDGLPQHDRRKLYFAQLAGRHRAHVGTADDAPTSEQRCFRLRSFFVRTLRGPSRSCAMM